MPDMISVSTEEWEKLEKRAKKLAGDKSYLQLLVNMMQQLGTVAGLENVVDAVPRIVMENIGGTNLILYYFIDQDIYRTDLYGNRSKLDAIDDPEVARVAERREMAEYCLDAANAQMQESALPHAWSWIFPLQVGSDLIGVFRIENLHISTQEWRQQLPTFFSYAALVLKNEILGYSRLQTAYRNLEQEVTIREQAEEELRTANEELQLKLDTLLLPDQEIQEDELRNILNTQELHSILEKFSAISQVATAIVDLKGEVLVGIGWQNVCVKFHRVNPQTLENCRESDIVLTNGIKEGQCLAYRCKNNLWDVSTPLFIGDKHVANIFLGQFFYEDAPPNLDAFAAQAEQFGFDKENYLAAIKQVPLCSREKIDHLMAFYGKFAAWVSKLSFSNLKLAKSLLDNKRIGDELRRAKDDLEQIVAERTADLSKTTEELNQFFSLALDMLCIADTDGKFHRLNLAWEKILGYTRTELMATRFIDFVHPDDVGATLSALEQLASQQEVVGFVNRYRCKDGAYRWLEWQATPAGHLIYAAAHDITDRKNSEANLLHLNAALDQRVKDEIEKNREKDLILMQQSRLAAMGEMVHNIAHQWRQPINTLGLILANIQDAYTYNDLSEEFLDEEVSKGRQLIDRMSATIDDFRDFFRPDREPEEFELSDAVEDALSVMESSLKNNFIHIDNKLQSGIVINGFPNQFAQVVLNILANAKEAILQRQVEDGEIKIVLQEIDQVASLTICDNGGGMEQEVLPRIFDPYFTTKNMGSGIGLYMSKMIIERNFNGRIQASNTAKGACFTIILPLRGNNNIE